MAITTNRTTPRRDCPPAREFLADSPRENCDADVTGWVLMNMVLIPLLDSMLSRPNRVGERFRRPSGAQPGTASRFPRPSQSLALGYNPSPLRGLKCTPPTPDP